MPSNSPHDHMILRVELVGSLGEEVETPLPSNHPMRRGHVCSGLYHRPLTLPSD